MCETRLNTIIALARAIADNQHALTKLIRQDNEGLVDKARQELEERGDEGALWFLERLANTKPQTGAGLVDALLKSGALDEPVEWEPSAFLKGEV